MDPITLGLILGGTGILKSIGGHFGKKKQAKIDAEKAVADGFTHGEFTAAQPPSAWATLADAVASGGQGMAVGQMMGSPAAAAPTTTPTTPGVQPSLGVDYNFGAGSKMMGQSPSYEEFYGQAPKLTAPAYAPRKGSVGGQRYDMMDPESQWAQQIKMGM